uniref:Mediator complex subunit Med25 PTOV domain-containing protein n=2 Tax=Homalodisca liturata TaxID=320908 RepID=A0A1B6K299_9HEMI
MTDPSSRFFHLSISQDEKKLHIVWEGILECISYIKTPSKVHKNLRPIRAQISMKVRDVIRGEEEQVQAGFWPRKILLQLLPDHVVSEAMPDAFFFCKKLFLHPQDCEALGAISEILMNTYVGVLHINCQSSDTILMILLYTPCNERYDCFIPKNQTLFYDTLQMVIQYQEENSLPLSVPIVGYTWFHKLVKHEVQTIWRGTLEWTQEYKSPSYTKTSTFRMPCEISCFSNKSEAEIDGCNWPEKLTMELVPTQVIKNVGVSFQKNSKTILLHPEPSEALHSLTSLLISGFAGCVHIPSQQDFPNDIKVMVLMFNTKWKGLYLGFAPNNQEGFINNLCNATQDDNTPQTMKQQKQDLEERVIIWQGVLGFPVLINHWQTTLRSAVCQISAKSNNGQPEVRAELWSQKVIMQLLSGSVIREVCAAFFTNSKSVLLHLQPCDALMSLNQAFMSGYVGYVHLTCRPHLKKLMIVQYIACTGEYRGFIPCDQAEFFDRILKVMQNHQKKTVEALNQQGQAVAPAQNLSMNTTQEQIDPAEQEAGAVGGVM